MLYNSYLDKIKVDELQLEECRKLFGWYTIDEFYSCVKTIKRCWIDIDMLHSSKHDAVKSKFDSQDIVKVREVKAPQVSLAKVESWFYVSKDSKFENDDEICEMQIE